MLKKLSGRPALSLLPFFFLYVVIIVLQNSEIPFGDEGRYLQFAGNLINGFYSPPAPGINLWNGPGFPLYLYSFVAFGAPHLVIKLCNAVLAFASLLVINRTLRRFLSPERSFIVSVAAGLYFMPYKSLPYILSETFTIFILSMITLLATTYFIAGKKSYQKSIFIALAILLAILALTKVLFGQVYLFTALACLLISIYKRKSLYRHAAWLLITALLLCSPYLVYTYSLTGKVFYWSNAGGMSLYWMSNPAAGEWGEWYNDSITSPLLNDDAKLKLQSNHRTEFDDIHRYEGIERDHKFKDYATRHIREHPGKFLLNWLANWSRMFFNYPVGYAPFRWSTFFNMLANIPVLILLVYSAVLTARRKSTLPFSITFLLLLSGVYLAGSSLLSAYDRMLYILVPVMSLWIGYSVFIFGDRYSGDQKSK